MTEIQKYMNCNKLKLNPEKTLMIMTTKNKNMHSDLKINFNGAEIEQNHFAK